MFYKNLLLTGLNEDQWQWDFTTLGVLPKKESTLRGTLRSKSDGIWVGEGFLREVVPLAREFGFECQVVSTLIDGESIAPGHRIAELSGSARFILAIERPLLNLMAFASGIATKTKVLVDRVKKRSEFLELKKIPKVCATRKILPHYRDLSIYSVLAGGGYSHRVHLAGGILIKENHLTLAGGVLKAVDRTKKTVPHGLKIEVEVKNLSELREAIEAKADAILLDNFNPSQVSHAVQEVQRSDCSVLLEVSGGIQESNIEDYVIEGVDVISVGALTHNVKALDTSFVVDP